MIGFRAFDASPGRRRRMSVGMAGSVAVHLLFAVGMVWYVPNARPVDKLTEITLIDPDDLEEPGPAPREPAAASATALSSEPTSGAASEHDRDERFRRSGREDLAPTNQIAMAMQDRLASRLATMQSAAVVPSAGVVKTAPPSPWSVAPATVPGTGGSGAAPVALKREAAGGPTLALVRETGTGGGATLAPAIARAPESVTREAAPARSTESTARRSLAGATLMGPIADRSVMQQATPIYPDWAKREAVEASVTLYFVVRPDGSVRENVLVQKTAGFEDFDENARAALRAWRFEPLREGRTGDQWGTITFHYKIRDGG